MTWPTLPLIGSFLPDLRVWLAIRHPVVTTLCSGTYFSLLTQFMNDKCELVAAMKCIFIFIFLNL